MRNCLESNSTRTFLMTWIEDNKVVSKEHLIDRIIQVDNKKSEYEYIYALQSEIDMILDLRVGDII